MNSSTVARRLMKVAAVSLLLLSLAWLGLRLSSPIRVYEGKGFSRITHDRRGNVLDISVSADGRYRAPILFSDIPEACIDATLTYEDARFFRHPGIDPFSLLRAALSYASGTPRGGASTIPMQVVRLRSPHGTRSISGKLRQLFEALVLERHLSKREILTAYFTFAPYGGAVEGLAAASALYFGRPASTLSPAECAALAVLPQAPAARTGFRGEGFDQAYRFLVDKLDISPTERFINLPERFYAPHFARHLTGRMLSGGGFAQTTIDLALQRQSERILSEYIDSRAAYGLRNGAVLIANAASDEVLVYIGSKNFVDGEIRGFVDGVRALRSPGSLLKPFIYAKAIDEGAIIPDSIIADVPVKLTSYEPENFERDFLGPITAREALVKSRNIPALLLNSQLAGEGLYSLLRSSGIYLPKRADYYGAAVVLGGIEISLFDAVRLYISLARRGEYSSLRTVSGERPRERHPPLFSKESAFLTRDMLQSNPAPPGFPQPGIAWKTGTSSGSRDAWAVGVRGALVIGVWLGNFDNTPNPNFVGRDLAGPLLFQLFERTTADPAYLAVARATLDLRNNNLSKADICPESGRLRGPHCPHRKQAWIIPGISPIQRCDLHRSASGEAIHSSEVNAYHAGVGLRLGRETRYGSRQITSPPRITSPERGVEYRITSSDGNEVEFRAVSDGEVSRIDWYVGSVFVGTSRPGESFFWQAEPGRFIVRAVDDLGLSDAVEIVVAAQPL